MPGKLEDIGEFGTIGRIARSVFTSPAMALDFQDDAALWQWGGGWLIATTDALVEDVDFRLRTFSWEDIGWKALAVNLSDIAAMGGSPRGALVALCLPAESEVAQVDAFYRGMSLLAEQARTPILGGDLSSSAQVMVNVTVFGEVESSERVLRRSVAQVGDQIGVTGVLGNAAAGLALLEGLAAGDTGAWERLIAAQRRPAPRLREGRALVAAGVRCGMDISDGLVVDLQKLCAASGVSAEIACADVPTDPDLAAVLGDDCSRQALNGGEDYELLFTAPPATMQRAQDRLTRLGLATCTIVGRIVAGSGGEVVLRGDHGEALLPIRKGFDHFDAAAVPRKGRE